MRPGQSKKSISVVRLQMVREGDLPYSQKPVKSSADAAAILRSFLAGADREYFVVLLLDGRHRVHALNVVSIGTLTSSIVHAREVFKPAILTNSAAMILGRVRHRYRHILVDEYQDTCPLQERMLRLIASPGHNICAVGDDDRSIYSFRYADVRGILTFEDRYPGAKVIRMEENYRSTGLILEVARRVISVNRERKPKVIHTRNGQGPPVEVVGFPSEEEEAAWILGKIRDLLSGKLTRWRGHRQMVNPRIFPL